MGYFLAAGGFSMWIVMLFSGLCLFASARFAWRALPRRLAIIRALTAATVFAVISGVSANFVKVMWTVTGNDEFGHHPDLHLIVMRGLGESVTPAILGFTVLSLCWILVAVGTRRFQDQD